MLKYVQREESRVLVLDMAAVTDIDYSAKVKLERSLKKMLDAHVVVIMGRVHGIVMDRLIASGIADLIGRENIFIGLPDAVRRAQVVLDTIQSMASQWNASELALADPSSSTQVYQFPPRKTRELDSLENVDRGFPLTRNVHTYAHREDDSAKTRHKLWWKLLH
jgi:hypothetical protein